MRTSWCNLKQKWGDGMGLISREALIEDFRELNWLQGDTAVIEDIINEQPTIEAVPVVHAEWKMRGGKLYCTNCGKKALEEKDRDDWYGCERSNFCPHCGADMRKKVRYGKGQKK